MAWHVFEKLLEGVANYSTFIGKLWITFFFIFRIIMVASVGDTVYSDEQSQFICNTLQPGCTNVCFNRFSPISQIRFWAVQILFVGMPSVIFIVFAMHKMSSLSHQEQEDQNHASRRDGRYEGSQSVDYDHKARRRRGNENTSEKSVEARGSNQTSLPQYDDVANGKQRPANGVVKMKDPRKSSSNHSKESVYTDKRLAAQVITMPGEEKKKVRMKTVYNKDGKSEVVKTPSIARAYFAQTIITTCIEGLFLVLQYNMYAFQVHELYECEGDPCPKQVDCYVSRPQEKTLFLLFMYAMTSLSILINVVELLHLIRKYVCGSNNTKGGSSMKRLMGYHRPHHGTRRRRRRYSSRYVPGGAYPSLGPFPRTHENSFSDLSGSDSMDSDYRYYSK
uniref:gap junction alpha-4 protein-like n=1 Tax=Styela clava TaxID=7725 RepID=UPI0019398BF0|nr:gap junction alpha-4 protein-like [Styela clava]